MTYKSKSAVYALNSYTWKLLQVNLGWEDYNGVPPIIPTAQQPEMLASGKAFIVYGSAMHPPDHLYALNTEAVSYLIYAPTSTEANNVASLFYETFKRQDDAATDVNDWLAKESATRTGGHRGVNFATIRSIMIEKAEPADEEGGFVSALVMLETKYVTTAPAEIITAL